jgi:hypothetical protein
MTSLEMWIELSGIATLFSLSFWRESIVKKMARRNGLDVPRPRLFMNPKATFEAQRLFSKAIQKSNPPVSLKLSTGAMMFTLLSLGVLLLAWR